MGRLHLSKIMHKNSDSKHNTKLLEDREEEKEEQEREKEKKKGVPCTSLLTVLSPTANPAGGGGDRA